MGFSTQVLILALVAAAVGVASARTRSKTLPVIAAAVGGSAAVTVIGRLLLGAATDIGRFAQFHIAYLALTVTVPAMAVAGLWAARRGHEALRSQWTQAFLAVGLVPAVLGAYATHLEPNWLRVDHVELVQDHGGGVRIGVLSDLQTPNIGSYERKAIQRLLDEEPDLVLIPGDLWQMTDSAIVDRWPQFRDLILTITESVEHVVIVEGDSDHSGWLVQVVDGTGAHFLADETIELDIDGQSLLVGGLELTTWPKNIDQSVLTALEAAPAETTTILLSHRPEVLTAVTPGTVDLIVAGHTHGGQIALPFLGPLLTPSDLPREVGAGGLHDHAGHWIYISTGVGLERVKAPQVRFLVRPSIGIIDFVEDPA